MVKGDRYRQHVIGRRLGSMEVIFLMLGEKICDSSATKKLSRGEHDLQLIDAQIIYLDDQHINLCGSRNKNELLSN